MIFKKMRFLYIITGLIFGSVMMKSAQADVNKTLFDFTTVSNIDNWEEISDTVRSVGMSKAVLSLQKTQKFQRAIFFTLLNPQSDGSAFAGMRSPVTWNLSKFDELRIKCRGQGQNSDYKVILRHKNQTSNNDKTYEKFFKVPMSNSTFGEVSVLLMNFTAYFRGREVADAEALDLSQLSMFGLQAYGGVYLPIKQSGVSALEIERIEARQR